MPVVANWQHREGIVMKKTGRRGKGHVGPSARHAPCRSTTAVEHGHHGLRFRVQSQHPRNV